MPAPGAVAAARAAEAALLHAARVGTVDDVRAVASRVAGSSLADIDAPGPHGVTPLHAAATRGDVDVARALLDAGAACCHSHARPLRLDAESGWTATHRAMYHGKWRVVQALLERGGSLDHPRDLAGRTPLDVLAARLRRSREKRRRYTLSNASQQTSLREEFSPYTRDVYSWGSGVNYQLGHGSRDDVSFPRRVDELANVGGGAVSVSCAKFHSVAAFRDGTVFSWGHGRGGRLGVNEPGVHDGDVAALTPTKVSFPVFFFKNDDLPNQTHFVTRVAAGKHHTLAVTRRGALFSWGRAADGRLGYDVRDCDVEDDAGGAYQRTPRLVLGALRDAFVVDVAAANRHSVLVTRSGEVFAFGSNAHGQLGRRPKTLPKTLKTPASVHTSTHCSPAHVTSSVTSSSPPASVSVPSSFERESLLRATLEGNRGSPSGSPASSSAFLHGFDESESCEWSPAAADALKPLGRVFVGVSASKRHTVVLDAAGAVYQFGQGDYSPRRVALKDDERSSSSASSSAAAEIAAGANVSLARARDGSVWGWFSRDPHLRAFRVAGFGAGHDTDAVSVAACKSVCAVVTGAGDACLFDAPEFPGGDTKNGTRRFKGPAFAFRRVEGVRRVDAIALGELHALATQALTRPSTGGASSLDGSARGARAKTTPVEKKNKATFSDSAFSLAADRLAGGADTLADGSESEFDSDSDSSAAESDATHDASDDSDEASAFRFGVFFGDDEEATEERDDGEYSESTRNSAFTRLKNKKPRRSRAKLATKERVVPSLRSLAQDSLARSSCDARSVLELLAFAESVGADTLAAHCRTFFVENADAVLAERGGDALAGVPAETLKILEARSAEIEPDAVHRDEADEAFILEAVRNGCLCLGERESGIDTTTSGLLGCSVRGSRGSVQYGDAAVDVDDERAETPPGDEYSTPDDGAVAAAVVRSARTRVPAEDASRRTNANVNANANANDANGANGGLSWLEARGVRGVAKEPPRSPTPPTRPSRVLGGTGTAAHTWTYSRSQRAAADAAASRVARGGLSLFLSGALEDAVERGGGDAAVAAAAAARDARRRAPPRGWGAPGDPGDGDDRPGSGSRVPGPATSAPSLREIAAAQEREAREAAARARGYAATAARDIAVTESAREQKHVVYAPVLAPARVAAPGGATAVSLAALASRSRGAYGGRGEAKTPGFDPGSVLASVETVSRAWSGGGFGSVSLSEIVREEEAAAKARRVSSLETHPNGRSLGKSGWFVPDAHRGSPSSGGLAGIVRDEEAKAAAAAAREEETAAAAAAAGRTPAARRRKAGKKPTKKPTKGTTKEPTNKPTKEPTKEPTREPSKEPSKEPRRPIKRRGKKTESSADVKPAREKKNRRAKLCRASDATDAKQDA